MTYPQLSKHNNVSTIYQRLNYALELKINKSRALQKKNICFEFELIFLFVISIKIKTLLIYLNVIVHLYRKHFNLFFIFCTNLHFWSFFPCYSFKKIMLKNTEFDVNLNKSHWKFIDSQKMHKSFFGSNGF